MNPEEYEEKLKSLYNKVKAFEQGVDLLNNKLKLLIAEYSDKHPREYMNSDWL